MNVLALVAACDHTDPRTDPGCYGDGTPSTLAGHAADAWATTLDQITHPATSWPGLLGVVFWLIAAALAVTLARPLLANRGGKAAAGTAAKGAAGAVRGVWGVFAKARTRSESVHVPTVEGEPQ